MHLASVSVHVGEMFAEGPRAYRVSLGFSPDPVDLQGEGAQFGEILALQGGSDRVAVAASLRAMADRLDAAGMGRDFLADHSGAFGALAASEATEPQSPTAGSSAR